jgi:hypothetical protein
VRQRAQLPSSSSGTATALPTNPLSSDGALRTGLGTGTRVNMDDFGNGVGTSHHRSTGSSEHDISPMLVTVGRAAAGS